MLPGVRPCRCSAAPPPASPRSPSRARWGCASPSRCASRRAAGPSESELRSWERSLPVLAQDLVQAGLDDVEVLVEHALPLSSKRIDVVLAGQHPRTRQPSYVVVELKQWSRGARAGRTTRSSSSSTAYGVEPAPAPGRAGAGLLRVPRSTSPASLHDQPDVGRRRGVPAQRRLDEAAVADLCDYPQDAYGRLFTGAERGDWLELPARRTSTRRSPARRTPTSCCSSASAPSQAAARRRRRRGPARASSSCCWTSSGSPTTSSCTRSRRRRRGDHKSVVLVTGGPGSGKSVIALSLLGELARRGRTVVHATGSRSFTQTLRKVAGAPLAAARSGCSSTSTTSWTAERNGLDVLILDEAHRIRETSVSRWTRKELRSESRAADRRADRRRAGAGVPARRAPGRASRRAGHRRRHRAARARRSGSPCTASTWTRSSAAAAARCTSQWVLRLLGLAPGGPVAWDGDDAFEVRTADGAGGARAAPAGASCEDGYGARMTAGYCWPWSDPTHGRHARPGRADRRLGAAVEPQGRPRRRRRAAGGAVGQRPTAASGRSAASTPRRASSTTGTASSSGRTSCGGRTAGSRGRRANKDPDFRNRTHGQRRASSTGWCATSTRCC